MAWLTIADICNHGIPKSYFSAVEKDVEKPCYSLLIQFNIISISLILADIELLFFFFRGSRRDPVVGTGYAYTGALAFPIPKFSSRV